MRVERSKSQILFGFLPDQTVDLEGGIWRVRWWDVDQVFVEDSVIRDELMRVAFPWAAVGADRSYVEDLRRGHTVKVVKLGSAGVRVDRFPDVWTCNRCSRVAEERPNRRCACGGRRWSQMPFVGYHECGALQAPWIPQCPEHHEAKVIYPGTSSLSEISVRCPSCDRFIQSGLGFRKCSCGAGTLKWNVHRAAAVYRPASISVVTPPTTRESKQLMEAGGGARALSWVIDGMVTGSVLETGNTVEAFVRNRVADGMSEDLARKMAQMAVDAGELDESGSSLPDLSQPARERAEREARTIGFATLRSRVTLEALAATSNAELRHLYRDRYPRALEVAGLEGIELIDRFPVLTGQYGYTRGTEGDDRTPELVPFEDRRSNEYIVYAQPVETEALFFRLSPARVIDWLRARGHDVRVPSDPRAARLAILRACHLPEIGTDPSNGPGDDLLTLIHSFAHRTARAASIHAGIDVAGLAEVLVPSHLGFFIYAAGRGDFVLGGLQAMFEYELEGLLTDVAEGESRCPLDPGCRSGGAACMACLHLGEPSCRGFNTFLSRAVLFGPTGYFA